MFFFYPLKPFERIWDRIEKSKGLPKWLKSLLLILVAITMLANSIWSFLLIKQITNLISTLLGHPPPVVP